MVFLLMCYQPLNVLSYFSSSLKIERYPVIVWQKKKNNVLVEAKKFKYNEAGRCFIFRFAKGNNSFLYFNLILSYSPLQHG